MEDMHVTIKAIPNRYYQDAQRALGLCSGLLDMLT